PDEGPAGIDGGDAAAQGGVAAVAADLQCAVVDGDSARKGIVDTQRQCAGAVLGQSAGPGNGAGDGGVIVAVEEQRAVVGRGARQVAFSIIIADLEAGATGDGRATRYSAGC